jgi:Flp pilus assembly protein TadD
MDAGQIDRLMREAVSLERQGRLADAERVCQQILSAGRDPRALCLLGTIHQRLGRHDVAIAAVSEAARGRLGHVAELWFSLGISHHALGRLPEAADAIGRAAGLQPGSARYWAGLGEIPLKRGDRSGAAVW